MSGGVTTPPDTSEAASGPQNARERLQARLDRLQARHGSASREPSRDITEPSRSPERENIGHADAVANVKATLPIAWETTFHRTTGHDGETMYVHTVTGETYAELPNLHSRDGKPA